MRHRVKKPIKPVAITRRWVLLAELVNPPHTAGFFEAEIFAACH